MKKTHVMVRSCLSALLMLCFLPTAQATSVRVVALFPDRAMVMIDGQRKLIKVGDKPVSGVSLIEANSRGAVIESGGVRRQYGLSRDMGGGIQTHATESRIIRNNLGQYITQGTINDQTVDMLLDTGANVVAINANEARRLGIDYKSGETAQVNTASGETTGYRVTLSSLSVGGIKVPNVAATVLEGNYPEMILLGMSYLKHVKFSVENDVMLLQSRY